MYVFFPKFEAKPLSLFSKLWLNIGKDELLSNNDTGDFFFQDDNIPSGEYTWGRKSITLLIDSGEILAVAEGNLTDGEWTQFDGLKPSVVEVETDDFEANPCIFGGIKEV